MTKDVSKSECGFTADLVPYMYDELGAMETSRFESHLVECVECRDEFAAVSNARYEVYDWKRTEFEPLETPVFEIPYSATPDSAHGVSWAHKLRAAFSNGWAIPSVAFAAVALVSIFAGTMYFSGEGEPTVTEVSSNSKPASVPSVQPVDVKKDIAVKDDEQSPSEHELNPIRASAPVSPAARHRPRNAVAVKQVEVRTTTATNRAAPATKRKAPTLNEFTEEEDTSLRLAQLFEDIDTRD